MTYRVEQNWLERWYNLTGVKPASELSKVRSWGTNPATQKVRRDALSTDSKKFRNPANA